MREWVGWLEGWVTARVALLEEVLESCVARVRKGKRAAVEQVGMVTREQRELLKMLLTAKGMEEEARAREAEEERRKRPVEFVFVNDWRADVNEPSQDRTVQRHRVAEEHTN